MKYFLGIVPPEDIYQKLLAIQTQYGDNRLEPHITLRPPVTPGDDEEWLPLRIYYKPDPHGRYQTYKDVLFG